MSVCDSNRCRECWLSYWVDILSVSHVLYNVVGVPTLNRAGSVSLRPNELMTWWCRCGQTWWGLKQSQQCVLVSLLQAHRHTESLFSQTWSVFCLSAAAHGRPTRHRRQWKDGGVAMSNWGEQPRLKLTRLHLNRHVSARHYMRCDWKYFSRLPPQGPTLPEDGGELSFVSPQRCRSSPSPSQYCQMEVMAALFASCLALTVHVLCVSAQFTGTEMPCEDLSPSPSTPTSGKTHYIEIQNNLSNIGPITQHTLFWIFLEYFQYFEIAHLNSYYTLYSISVSFIAILS